MSDLLSPISRGIDRTLTLLGRSIDRTVGIVSPRSEVQRIHDRIMVDKARMYAAAKVTRSTGDWMPVNQDANVLIRSSAPMLRARVRQLVRDCPHFARAVNIQVEFTVGTGMHFQSRIQNTKWQPGSKESRLDRVACQKIEDAVNWWMDEADAAGRLHFGEMERLAKRQDVEVGEYLFVKTFIKNSKRYIPFALSAYETDWLTSDYSLVAAGNQVEQGKEFDPLTGCIVAYHFRRPTGFGIYDLGSATGKTTRIPAEYVVNGFDQHRAGQMSGISPLVTAVLIAHDLDDFIGATVDTAKLAAKYLALIETANPAEFQGARGATAVNGQKIEELENAIIEYLRPGEKVTFAKPDTVGAAFDPFTKFILRVQAIGSGISYSLLSGDYSDTNYTTLRGERQDMLRMFKYPQFRHVKHFAAPIIQEAIGWAVMSNKLVLPGYASNPRPWWRAVYIPPGAEPIDPLRESKANRDDMAGGLRSPQEIAAARGRDLEEVYDEIAEARDMAEARGLNFEEADTALAGNPAALGATEGAPTAAIKKAVRAAVEDALLLLEGEDNAA